MVTQNDESAPGAGSSPRRGRSGSGRLGNEARQWFSDHGYDLYAENAVVICDELLSPGFRVSRIWHTAATIKARGPRSTPLVLLQVEGASRFSTAPTAPERHVEAGGIAFVPAGAVVRITQDEQVARFEIEADRLPLPVSIRQRLSEDVVLSDGSSALVSVLIACINAALNGGVRPGDSGYPAFKLAVAELTAGVLVDASMALQPRRSARESELFLIARRLIADRATDSDFTVAALAREMQLSGPYLRSIFAAHGTTARAEIRERRSLLAASYRHRRSGLSAAEAAGYSGFRDVETMRESMHRTTSRSDEPLGT